MKCAYQELENVISIGLQKESLYLVLQSDLILANLISAGCDRGCVLLPQLQRRNISSQN